MKRIILSVLTLGIWCLPELSGQQASINPPALGFVFDSHALRPVFGVPGASLLGTNLDIGLDLADAIVSPNQDYALLLAGERRELTLVNLVGNVTSPSSIDGAMDGPDIVAFSSKGDTAALYRASDGLVQVFTGMPDSPRILREIPSGAWGAALTSMAIADDGQAILAALPDKVVLIPLDAAPRLLPIDDPISAISFRPGTHDAILASRNNNHVSMILHALEVPAIQSLGSPEDGILDPVAVAFSLDGSRAIIANSGGDIVQFDLSAMSPRSFSCQCRITGLHRLAGNAVFGLTNSSDGPLLVFDGDAPQPRVVFVPTPSAGGSDDVR